MKPEDRAWRVALDMGIGHEKPEHPVAETKTERGPLHRPVSLIRTPGVDAGLGLGVARHGFGFGISSGRSSRDIRWRDMRHAVNDVLQTDRTYAWELRKNGASEAVGKYMSDDVRLFRDGGEPAEGKLAAIQALATSNRMREWIPLGSKVSTSFDLGYSWGLARTVEAPHDTTAYLHIWRCDPRGKWALVADVENAFVQK